MSKAKRAERLRRVPDGPSLPRVSDPRVSLLIVRPFSFEGHTYERGEEQALAACASARVLASLTTLGYLKDTRNP